MSRNGLSDHDNRLIGFGILPKEPPDPEPINRVELLQDIIDTLQDNGYDHIFSNGVIVQGVGFIGINIDASKDPEDDGEHFSLILAG